MIKHILQLMVILFLNGCIFKQNSSSISSTKSIVDTESLLSFIDANKPNTIDDILPQLSSQFRENFLFIHTSRSTHEANVEFPRIVTYNPERNTIFALTGSASLRGGNKIETISFNRDTGEFQFKGFELKPSAGSDRSLLVEDSQSCRNCHGTKSPRPIWDTYRVWPGIYGAIHFVENEKESSDFNKFLKNKDTGRFAYFRSSPLSVGFGGQTSPNSLAERSQSNTIFSTFLERLNLRRIAIAIKNKAGPEGVSSLCAIFKAADKREYELKVETAKEGARWSAKNPNAIVPDFEKVKEMTKKQYNDYLENRLSRLAATFGVMASDELRRRNAYISVDFIPYSIGLNYLASLYGLDPSGWSLTANSSDPDSNKGQLLSSSLVLGAGTGVTKNLEDSGACSDLTK